MPFEKPEPALEETVVQELQQQGQRLTQKFLEPTRELERLLEGYAEARKASEGSQRFAHRGPAARLGLAKYPRSKLR